MRRATVAKLCVLESIATVTILTFFSRISSPLLLIPDVVTLARGVVAAYLLYYRLFSSRAHVATLNDMGKGLAILSAFYAFSCALIASWILNGHAQDPYQSSESWFLVFGVFLWLTCTNAVLFMATVTLLRNAAMDDEFQTVGEVGHRLAVHSFPVLLTAVTTMKLAEQLSVEDVALRTYEIGAAEALQQGDPCTHPTLPTTSGPCCICLEDFCLGDPVIELRCHHVFHEACAKSWLRAPSMLSPDRGSPCPLRCTWSWKATPSATSVGAASNLDVPSEHATSEPNASPSIVI
eukprot:TRINITY_DN74198_c0_g1_i1.p1 TRINITY_DN74198_c0_g1~~TRINITY_DN74198_c0_g1_i1.p1  ORF type:complete len:311 (-),score=29.27 TRINITY_DN74198_c0_g1_i1:65-943(-)